MQTLIKNVYLEGRRRRGMFSRAVETPGRRPVRGRAKRSAFPASLNLLQSIGVAVLAREWKETPSPQEKLDAPESELQSTVLNVFRFSTDRVIQETLPEALANDWRALTFRVILSYQA